LPGASAGRPVEAGKGEAATALIRL
jgi:hypothetical protein